MALISLRQLLDHAAQNSYGVPAFNVNNLEQTRAIMEAADDTNSPVIMQASAGARKYAGAPFLRHLMFAALEEFPHIPIAIHLHSLIVDNAAFTMDVPGTLLELTGYGVDAEFDALRQGRGLGG